MLGYIKKPTTLEEFHELFFEAFNEDIKLEYTSQDFQNQNTCLLISADGQTGVCGTNVALISAIIRALHGSAEKKSDENERQEFITRSLASIVSSLDVDIKKLKKVMEEKPSVVKK